MLILNVIWHFVEPIVVLTPLGQQYFSSIFFFSSVSGRLHMWLWHIWWCTIVLSKETAILGFTHWSLVFSQFLTQVYVLFEGFFIQCFTADVFLQHAVENVKLTWPHKYPCWIASWRWWWCLVGDICPIAKPWWKGLLFTIWSQISGPTTEREFKQKPQHYHFILLKVFSLSCLDPPRLLR